MRNRVLMLSMLVTSSLAGTVGAQTRGAAGQLLRQGMELVYSSGGMENPPWNVEAIVRDTVLGGVAMCSIARIRMTAGQGLTDVRAHCVRGDTLFGWDSANARHRVLRPLGPRMTIVFPASDGRTVTYETADLAKEVVDGIELVVVPTIIITRDSTGRPVRRLQERYANALTSAVGGTFEAADSSSPGGWRVDRAFQLVRIRQPAP